MCAGSVHSAVVATLRATIARARVRVSVARPAPSVVFRFLLLLLLLLLRPPLTPVPPRSSRPRPLQLRLVEEDTGLPDEDIPQLDRGSAIQATGETAFALVNAQSGAHVLEVRRRRSYHHWALATDRCSYTVPPPPPRHSPLSS